MTPKPVLRLGENLRQEKGVLLGVKGKVDSGKVEIGDNAFIRSGAVIYQGVIIGHDCFIGHQAIIREKNTIGDHVVVGNQCYLGPENKIGDHVFIHNGCFIEMATIENNVAFGPNVTLTNDPHPRCPRYRECVGGVKIKKGAKIGAGAIILPGVTIGEKALVGAGSVVTKNVPAKTVVAGNPAKVVKKIEKLICRKGFFKKVYEWEKD